MMHLRRLVTFVAVCAFIAAAVIATLAQTAPQATRRIQPQARSEAPVPLASGEQTLSPGMTGMTLKVRPVPTFPPAPPHNGKSKSRTLKSLNGSTILLSGAANACFSKLQSGTVVTDDTILQASASCTFTWTPSNINDGYTATATRTIANYTDYFAVPGATSPTQIGTAGYLAAAAAGHMQTGTVDGTYVFGTYDNVNNVWVALLYVQVGNIVTLDTYADATFSTPIESMAVGSAVYIQGSGLTQSHQYAVGVENTSVSGQCVFIAPNTSGTTSLTAGTKNLCNLATTNTTGANAPSNALAFTWTPVAGAVPNYAGGAVTFAPGTYAIVLYDQTSGQTVAQRQIAVTGTSTTNVLPEIEFFSGSLTSGGTAPSSPNSPARIAYNGGPNSPHYDAAVTNLNVGLGAVNLPVATPAGIPKFYFTLTDPNGKVAYTSAATGNGTTSVSPTSVQTALPTPVAFDFAANYPTSTWTAGVLAIGQQAGATITTPAPLAVRGLKILSYAGATAFVGTSGGTETSVTLPEPAPSTIAAYLTHMQVSNVGDQAVGASNADPIKDFHITFPNKAFAYVNFYDENAASQDGGSGTDPTPCATGAPNAISQNTPCSQTFVRNRNTGAVTGNLVDSLGHPWTATISCTDTNPNQQCSTTSQFFLDMTPNALAYALPPGAYVQTPDFYFAINSATGNPCATGCAVTTSVFPVDGFGLSSGAKVDNNVYMQFGDGTARVLGNLFYFGYTSTGNPTSYVANELPSLYQPRVGATAAPAASFTSGPQFVTEAGQPFSAPGQIGLQLQIQDLSTGNDYIQTLGALFPPSIDLSAAAVYTLNGSTFTAQTIIAAGTGLCPASTLCWTGPSSTNLMANAASSFKSATVPSFQNYYIELTQPTKSFSYTDVPVSVVQGSQGTLAVRSANLAVPTYVGNPSTVDALTLGSYSLNAATILATLNPPTIGSNVGTNVTYSLQNTTSAQDPFPDYIDTYVVEMPNNTGSPLIAAGGLPTTCSTVVANTSNWSCIQVVQNSPAGYNSYWFAPTNCGELFTNSAGGNPHPPTGPNITGSILEVVPSVGCHTILQTTALAPGGQNAVTIPITTSAVTPAPGATPLAVTSYAHGANTNAWSNPISSSLQIAVTAQAAGGFSGAGPYTTATPTPVSSGSQPMITVDTNATLGNSYLYTVTNVGSVGIKQAVVTIPHLDAAGNGSTKLWSVTAAPTVTGASGCSVAYTNPTATTDGSITISGCTIATNASYQIRFNALSPGVVNSTYNWSAKLTDTGNNVVNLQPQWFADTTIAIALSASISVAVNSAPTCTFQSAGTDGPAAINVATNTIDFGLLTANQTNNCKQAVTTTVYTNASSPVGWTLYAQIQNNVPATSAPSGLPYELAIKDSTASGAINAPVAGGYFTYGSSTVYSNASTNGSPGAAVASSSGSGPASASATPYTVTTDLQLGSGTESIPYATATIVFTWISS